MQIKSIAMYFDRKNINLNQRFHFDVSLDVQNILKLKLKLYRIFVFNTVLYYFQINRLIKHF